MAVSNTCKGLSKMYVVAFATVVALIGLAILGMATYLAIEFKEFSDMFSEASVYIGIAVGCLVFLCSLVGCLGAMKQNKAMLGFYTFVMTILIICEIAAGVLMLIYVGALEKIDSGEIDAFQSSLAKSASDYELGVWTNCCKNVYSAQISAPEIIACGTDGKDPCWHGSDWATSLAASKEQCTLFKELTQAGSPLVGEPTAGGVSCGGTGDDSPLQFRKNLNKWAKKHANPVGIATIVVAVIQLVALICTCVLLCSNREDYDDQYRKKMEEQREMQAQAGALTGTQPNQYV